MDPVMFAVDKYGVCWLCYVVCSCCEVQDTSAFVEL